MNEAALLTPFSEWDPAQYLTDYYLEVEQDEQRTLPFLCRQLARIPTPGVALEFGVGPTVHHLLPLSPHVSEIHLADLLPGNLAEVRRWQAGEPGAHDWRPFTEFVLRHGETGDPDPGCIAEREALTRRRITRYWTADANCRDPLGADGAGRYDCVTTCYCADSVAADPFTWRRYLDNIMGLVRPGGFFLMTALRDCRWYRVGDDRFPAANINEEHVAELFDAHGVREAVIEVADTPDHEPIGYGSVVLAAGFVAG